jgi:uncharacterized phage-like protein YoqJ
LLCCTFIGHKDTPANIEPILESTLRDLIKNKTIDTFLVGTHGNFDNMAQTVLKRLKVEYPHINYTIVLAYLTKKNQTTDYKNTLFPDGLENVPPKFAIDRRNKWMIKNSNYLICYIRHSFSNSYKFKEYAEQHGKTVLNLYKK